MTTLELARSLGWKAAVAGEAREITGGYCGDLLSWVMGRAPQGSAWITVMTNVNVAAVAALCDVACVVLAQGAVPDEALRARAEREGIPILLTENDAYTAAVRLAQLLGEGARP